VSVQRRTVHKERNLLADALKHLHDAIKADCNDLMRLKTAAEVVGKARRLPTRLMLQFSASSNSASARGSCLSPLSIL
jgi:hypothetical protein